MFSQNKSHKSHSLENLLCLTQQGSRLLESDARAAFSGSELKLVVIGCSGWCLHDNPRARILGQEVDGKIPNVSLLSVDD